MDEASFQRMAAVVASQTMAASSPSKSSERLIDGRKTPEFELYSQIFPPELARQIMMGKNFFFFLGFILRHKESQKLFKKQNDDGWFSNECSKRKKNEKSQ